MRDRLIHFYLFLAPWSIQTEIGKFYKVTCR